MKGPLAHDSLSGYSLNVIIYHRRNADITTWLTSSDYKLSSQTTKRNQTLYPSRCVPCALCG